MGRDRPEGLVIGSPALTAGAPPSGEGLSARSYRIRWTPEIAAAFATVVDIARIRAAVEGRTMIYVVRTKPGSPAKRL